MHLTKLYIPQNALRLTKVRMELSRIIRQAGEATEYTGTGHWVDSDTILTNERITIIELHHPGALHLSPLIQAMLAAGEHVVRIVSHEISHVQEYR